MLFSAAAAHDVRQDMELLAVRHWPKEFNCTSCAIYIDGDVMRSYRGQRQAMILHQAKNRVHARA
jgi:hypothetical protein